MPLSDVTTSGVRVFAWVVFLAASKVICTDSVTADVAYIAKGDVWTASSSGADCRRLTFDGLNESPYIFHDGRRVAYIEVAKVVGIHRGGHLWIVDLPTGKSKRVFGGKDVFAYMRQGYDSPTSPWSPNDKWIVCSATNSRSLSHGHHDSECHGDVWVVPAAGGKPRRLVKGEDDAERGCQPGFVWSPSGRRILWWNTDLNRDFFHVVDLHGHDRTLRFARIPAGGSVGQLSPIAAWKSETKLVIALDQTWPAGRISGGKSIADAGISVVDSHGRRLSRSRDVYRVRGISHRLNSVVCVASLGEEASDTWLFDIGCHRRIARLDGPPKNGTELTPCWSPDDNCLATYSWDQPVKLFDREGQNPRRVFKAPRKRQIDDVKWAPNGRTLWIQSSLQSEANSGLAYDPYPNLWVVDAASGSARLLADHVRSGEVSVREDLLQRDESRSSKARGPSASLRTRTP